LEAERRSLGTLRSSDAQHGAQKEVDHRVVLAERISNTPTRYDLWCADAAMKSPAARASGPKEGKLPVPGDA